MNTLQRMMHHKPKSRGTIVGWSPRVNRRREPAISAYRGLGRLLFCTALGVLFLVWLS